MLNFAELDVLITMDKIDNTNSPRTSILAGGQAETEIPIATLHMNSTDSRSSSPKRKLPDSDLSIDPEDRMLTLTSSNDSSQLSASSDIGPADLNANDVETTPKRSKVETNHLEASMSAEELGAPISFHQESQAVDGSKEPPAFASLHNEELSAPVSTLQGADGSQEPPTFACVCCCGAFSGAVLLVPAACACDAGSRYCVDCMRQWITTQLESQVRLSVHAEFRF
jgi:hypothetical protein